MVSRQHKKKEAPRLPLTVVLNNIRSLYNVGSIFRTADGVGIEKIWLCGITGSPTNAQMAKTALGAEKEVPWEHHPQAASVIKDLKAQGYQIVFLEQMEGSVPYQMFEPQPPVCLVMGNEIEGVADEITPLCDAAIEIEMVGLKNSLNVSVAFGIVAYDLRHKLFLREKTGQRGWGRNDGSN
ncbi:MAG: RNA methyltransferase [Candidatus Omnitrophota bacterium]|nr:RNA methyltransferase [Candidatus Omnitrophota bacterium]